MKRLAINADDLGADLARNDGIFEAIAAGVVTGASIIANGPAFDDAVRRAKALTGGRVAFGVHVNLSEGRPLSSGLRVLVGPDDVFLGKEAARRVLARGDDPALAGEALVEIAAQVEAVLRAGLAVRHLDGHQHLHVYPGAIDAVVEVARRFEIPWVRVPEEPDPPRALEAPAANLAEIRAHRPLAARARELLAARGVRAPDRFYGMAVKGVLGKEALARVLATVEAGLGELMVHPARLGAARAEGPFAAFCTPARERELEALVDPELPRRMEEMGIRLVSLAEA